MKPSRPHSEEVVIIRFVGESGALSAPHVFSADSVGRQHPDGMALFRSQPAPNVIVDHDAIAKLIEDWRDPGGEFYQEVEIWFDPGSKVAVVECQFFSADARKPPVVRIEIFLGPNRQLRFRPSTRGVAIATANALAEKITNEREQDLSDASDEEPQAPAPRPRSSGPRRS